MKKIKINDKDIKGFEKVMEYINTEQKGIGMYRFKHIARVELQIMKKVDLGNGKVDLKFSEADKKDIKALIKCLEFEIKPIKKGFFGFGGRK